MTGKQISLEELNFPLHTSIAAFTAKFKELGFNDKSLQITEYWEGIGDVQLIAVETLAGHQYVLGADQVNVLTTIYVLANIKMVDYLDHILESLASLISEFEWRIDDDPEELSSRISIFGYDR